MIARGVARPPPSKGHTHLSDKSCGRRGLSKCGLFCIGESEVLTHSHVCVCVCVCVFVCANRMFACVGTCVHCWVYVGEGVWVCICTLMYFLHVAMVLAA